MLGSGGPTRNRHDLFYLRYFVFPTGSNRHDLFNCVDGSARSLHLARRSTRVAGSRLNHRRLNTTGTPQQTQRFRDSTLTLGQHIRARLSMRLMKS
jgi:hypothetical protein